MALRARLAGTQRVGVQVTVQGGAKETITVFRGMSRAEFEQIQRTPMLLSKGQRLGQAAEEGLGARVRHSWNPSWIGSLVNTPFVSTSGISKIAAGYAQRSEDVIVRLVLRRSDVLRGLNPHQAEFLARGGARVVEYSALSPAQLSWGPPRVLIQAGIRTGIPVVGVGAGGYLGGRWIGDKIAGEE
ncbi:MAG: hypothetical protein ABFS86_13975 [Planctomycetota bacterium]